MHSNLTGNMCRFSFPRNTVSLQNVTHQCERHKCRTCENGYQFLALAQSLWGRWSWHTVFYTYTQATPTAPDKTLCSTQHLGKVSVFQPGTQSQQNGAFSSIKTTLAEMIMYFPVYLRLCGSSLFEVSTLLPFYQMKAGDRCPVLNSVIFCIELFSKIITFQIK